MDKDSTTEAALIKRSGPSDTGAMQNQTDKNGGASAETPVPQPAANPQGDSESGRPRDSNANVRIKISPDGAVRDVKVRNK